MERQPVSQTAGEKQLNAAQQQLVEDLKLMLDPERRAPKQPYRRRPAYDARDIGGPRGWGRRTYR